MAPHGVPAELALVRLDALGDEPAAALGGAERGADLARRGPGEGGPQLRVVADLVLHLPQGLDRVPVAVRGGVLEPAEELLVHAAARLVHDRAQVERRRQLREVEHPVDLPVPVVDVDRVLEHARELGQAHPVRLVQAALQVREVAFHLGAQPVPPPLGEVLAVYGQDGVEVLAHRGRVGRVARHPGAIARAVLGGVDPQVGVRRDRGGVDVSVDVLGQPVHSERRAEAPEHVVAAEPPAADVEEHGADRVRAMQVVVDPEELLLDLGVPGHGERFVAEELPEDLLCHRHGPDLLPIDLRRRLDAASSRRTVASSPLRNLARRTWQIIDCR